jgi:hypothetical protein
MKLSVCRQALDGFNALSHSPFDGINTGSNRSTIQDHRACAAVSLPAAILGAGKAQLLPQEIQQGPARFDLNLVL